MEIEGFLSLIKGWAERQEDVKGVLLVGSYARGAAREDSDVDLVILTIKPELYLDSISFAENFGSISKWEKESHLISKRNMDMKQSCSINIIKIGKQ